MLDLLRHLLQEKYRCFHLQAQQFPLQRDSWECYFPNALKKHAPAQKHGHFLRKYCVEIRTLKYQWSLVTTKDFEAAHREDLISVCPSFSCATTAEGCFMTARCMNRHLHYTDMAMKDRLLGTKHF